MNDKIKKRDKNAKYCLIDDKEMKPVIDLTSLKSIDLEGREIVNSKPSINMKIKKTNDELNLPVNSLLNSTKINRSFSIDLNRKQDGSQSFNPQSNSNNINKVKESINHRVIKLYSLSPVKYKSIDNNKEQITRNISFNKLSTQRVQKRSSKVKNDTKHNPLQFNSIIIKASNGNLIVNNNKIKSQNSSHNTPSSIHINNPSDINNLGNFSLAKSKDSKQQNNPKISYKINNNSKNKNKKTTENEKEILNDTARASLSLFKITINDLVNRNKNNITFLRELDRTFKKFISKSISKYEQLVGYDGNETITSEEISKIEFHKIKNKAEYLENKLNNVIDENTNLKEKLKDQAKQLNQMKRILGNFQSQIKGITDFNVNDNNKMFGKQEVKSKSVLGNMSNKNKINISLYKYDEKSELQRSPFTDKKSSGNLTTMNKTENHIMMNYSECQVLRDEPKILEYKKRKKTGKTGLKVKDNLLENSITSIESENSADNCRELFYFQNFSNSQIKNNHPRIPKLELNKSNNENNKHESNTENNTEKNENRSVNTSLLTPESKLEYNHINSDDMNKKLSFRINYNNLNISREERAKSTSNTNEKVRSSNGKNPKSTNFLINLENLPKLDYNEEFLSKYDEFSPSWRNECKKLKGLNLGATESDVLKIEKTES